MTEKVDHVKETEAEVLVGLDMACLMNIAGNLRYRNEPVRVMHLAELLYEGVKQDEPTGSYGYDGQRACRTGLK